jgi:hypothetical protein
MCNAAVDFPEPTLLACEYDHVRRLRSFLDRLDQHDADRYGPMFNPQVYG